LGPGIELADSDVALLISLSRAAEDPEAMREAFEAYLEASLAACEDEARLAVALMKLSLAADDYRGDPLGWKDRLKSRAPVVAFSAAEIELIEKHIDKIEKADRAMREKLGS
jgi:hypothetical protein